MYIALSCMVVGIFVGWLVRKKVRIPTSAIMLIIICILLFILGLEIGFNKELLSSLPTLGLTSLLIAFFAVLGSLVIVKICTKWLIGGKENEE